MYKCCWYFDMNKSGKKITLRDVASRAGTSVSSVSRVVNKFPGVHPQLQTKIERALLELGYAVSPKRKARHSRSRLIYFVLANRDLQIPFHARILQAIENESKRHGDLVLFRAMRYAPDTSPSNLDLKRILNVSGPGRASVLPDGVLLSGLTYPNLLHALQGERLPVVFLGNNYSGPATNTDAVSFDGHQGSRDATRYLIELEHKRILFIGDPRLSWFSTLYSGYLQAMDEAGLTPLAQTKGLTDSFYSNGYASVEMAFSQNSDITAIFAGYDGTAMGAWKALNDRNLSVPRDVSLIGFDDEDYSAFTAPPLTTVRIDVESLGRELTLQLHKKLANPGISLPAVTLRTVLVKRGTCWPANSTR